MSVASPKSRERVARNFIKSYGRSRFRRLLEALAAGESGQKIADEFGVSRERVRQIEVRAFEKVQEAVKKAITRIEAPRAALPAA